MTSEQKESGVVTLERAIRHIYRTHMNTRAWVLPIPDQETIKILVSAVSDLLTPEFDRINHGPFEHPVSE